MGIATEVVTMGIAVYAAIIASVSLVLSIVLGVHELRKNKPKIKVKVSAGYLIDGDGKPSERMIIFEGLNSGLIDVILTGCGWLAKNGTKYQPEKPHLLHKYYLL
jgi:hypothetical protein